MKPGLWPELSHSAPLAREFGQRPSARAFPHERPSASIRGSPLPPRTTRRECVTRSRGERGEPESFFSAPPRLSARLFPGPPEGNVSRGAAENAEGKAIRTERRLWRSAAGMQTGPILFLLRALASSRETFSGSHFYAVHNTLTAPTRHAGGRARRTRSGSVSTHNASQSAQHRALLPSTALGGH